MGLLNDFGDMFAQGMNSPGMGAAMGLLQAGAPSRTPIGMGQALAMGMGGYQQAKALEAKRAQEQQLMDMQKFQFDQAKSAQAEHLAAKQALSDYVTSLPDTDPMKGKIIQAVKMGVPMKDVWDKINPKREDFTLGRQRFDGNTNAPIATAAPDPVPVPFGFNPDGSMKPQTMADKIRLARESRSPAQPLPDQIIQTENGPMALRRGSTQAVPITGQDGEPVKSKSLDKALPTSAAQKLMENQQNLRRASQALELIQGNDVGLAKGDKAATGWKGALPEFALQRLDPAGVDTRAAISDLGSLIIHDRSGAAVSASESPRLKPFIPTKTDDAATIEKKLNRFVKEYETIAQESVDFYRDSGYKVPADALKGTSKQQPAATFDALPPAPQFKGKRMQDDKGVIYRSDGMRWVQE